MNTLHTDCLNVIIGFVPSKCLATLVLVCKDWHATIASAPITVEVGESDRPFTTLKLTTVKFSGDVTMFAHSDGIMTFSIRRGFDLLDFFSASVSNGAWYSREISCVHVGKTSVEEFAKFKLAGILPMMLKRILDACVQASAQVPTA